jgi:Uma2 family endonuclease
MATSMAAPALADFDGVSPYDDIVRLHDVTWADYERLLEIRGDHSAPRYTYLEGELEIMSPSKTHESIKSTIGCLVEVWCLDQGIEFTAVGAWTLTDKALRLGVEPDECYVFGDDPERALPHLAIEVAWTRGALDKRRAYEKFGVAELWIWSRGQIQVYGLHDGTYTPLEQSEVLPGLDLRLVERCIELRTTSRAILEFRAALGR